MKYKPGWLQLVIFGSLTFGCYLSLGTSALILVAKIYDLPIMELQQLGYDQPNVVTALKLLQGMATVVIFLLPAIFFAYLSDQRPMKFLGLRKPDPKNFWWLGILLMAVALPFAGWLNQLNQQLHLPEFMRGAEDSIRTAEKRVQDLTRAMLDMKGPADFLAMLFLIGLLPAVCEELFFRGILQRIFIQVTKRPWSGIIITAILFSAFHLQFLGFLPRMFLGILLGAIYWYSGSIWPSILAHFLNNAVQVGLVYYDKSFIDKEPVIAPSYIIFSLIGLIVIIWYMRKISHSHFGMLYDTDDDLEIPNQK